MNDPTHESVPDARSRLKSRTSLLLVFALFAAPVLLAWTIFYLFPEIMEGETVNHGELVSPVRPLPPFELTGTDGQRPGNEYLRGKWTFVTLQRGPCDETCIEQLYKVRQVRLTQGKNIDRLQRLMFWDIDTADYQSLQELQAHFPGVAISRLEDGGDGPMLETFSLEGDDPLRSGSIYLVDPLGNLMMRYARDTDPSGMVKDLHRLLKYSGLG